MREKWFFWLILTAAALGGIFGVGVFTAAAQGEKPADNDSCLSCHAGLYMLHDTGKWYCMYGTQAVCSDCHGGVVGASDYDSAHTGLTAYPLRENSAVCQGCHGPSTTTYVNKFGAMGVLDPAPLALPAYEPAEVSAESGRFGTLLEPQPREPWRQVGLAAVLVCLAGFSLFAVRCCIEDRASGRVGSRE
jgi:hypothetical protein